MEPQDNRIFNTFMACAASAALIGLGLMMIFKTGDAPALRPGALKTFFGAAWAGAGLWIAAKTFKNPKK